MHMPNFYLLLITFSNQYFKPIKSLTKVITESGMAL